MSRPWVRNFVHSLIAVLAGNAIYFLLMPYLPSPARHVPFRTDLGLAVDAIFCLVVFAAVKVVSNRRHESRLNKQ
ncbi:MAG: hypothetical protein ACRD20_01630 [Terriglobales bacterium]